MLQVIDLVVCRNLPVGFGPKYYIYQTKNDNAMESKGKSVRPGELGQQF